VHWYDQNREASQHEDRNRWQQHDEQHRQQQHDDQHKCQEQQQQEYQEESHGNEQEHDRKGQLQQQPEQEQEGLHVQPEQSKEHQEAPENYQEWRGGCGTNSEDAELQVTMQNPDPLPWQQEQEHGRGGGGGGHERHSQHDWQRIPENHEASQAGHDGSWRQDWYSRGEASHTSSGGSWRHSWREVEASAWDYPKEKHAHGWQQQDWRGTAASSARTLAPQDGQEAQWQSVERSTMSHEQQIRDGERPHWEETSRLAASAAEEGKTQDRKIDPDDGQAYTLEDVRSKYREHFSEDEIQMYWREDCKPMSGSAAAGNAGFSAQPTSAQNEKSEEELNITLEPSSAQTKADQADGHKSYENEEWYQKWLRRQQNRHEPAEDPGSGMQPTAVPATSESSETRVQAPLVETDTAMGSATEVAASIDTAPVDIGPVAGADAAPAASGATVGDAMPTEASAGAASDGERKRDPDDGKVYSLSGCMAKYRGHFTDEEIAGYWKTDCKPLVQGESEDTKPPPKPYEQEEWYQKWLRRQQNKSRQIIEIG